VIIAFPTTRIVNHHLLRDVSAAIAALQSTPAADRALRTRAKARVDEAKLAAIEAFAKLNCWSHSARGFSISRLSGQRQYWDGAIDNHWLDHPLYFKAGRVCAAVVGQPYTAGVYYAEPGSVTRRCQAPGGLVDRGLRWRMPPNRYASIYYPGRTLFTVATAAPDLTPIVWLPEQNMTDLDFNIEAAGGAG
jgi:hypothetical protein